MHSQSSSVVVTAWFHLVRTNRIVVTGNLRMFGVEHFAVSTSILTSHWSRDPEQQGRSKGSVVSYRLLEALSISEGMSKASRDTRGSKRDE